MTHPDGDRHIPRRVFWRLLVVGLAAVFLVALPRLTNLGGYLIVDEADRWRWAEEFYRALIRGDLRAMMVGDGYPGIVPVWVETLWLLGESLRRSLLEGHWFGDQGVYMLFHVWNRPEHLSQQRLPIAIFNSILALATALSTGKVFGKRIGLVALVLIALNPFYLSDSRVNRAEAIITGLLTLSILSMLLYDRTRRKAWLLSCGVLVGLSILTKIQGLVPSAAADAVNLLGSATVPVATLILGATLGTVSLRRITHLEADPTAPAPGRPTPTSVIRRENAVGRIEPPWQENC